MIVWIGAALCILGTLFFIAGALGLLRLPDTLSRLHALTKADNVGLGLIALGCGLLSGDLWFAIKCLFIWLVMLVVSSLTGVLIAGRTLAQLKPDRPPTATLEKGQANVD